MRKTIPWLEADNLRFPPADSALQDPNGLVAVGGDLSAERLLAAYRAGIFPWYEDGQPILWWSPDPRSVLAPEDLRVSRSLRRTLRRSGYRVTADRAFEQVIHACAGAREGARGTWITEDMTVAYTHLHRLGHAHSIETWAGETLVGGLYGLAIGRLFFGESMFSHRTDASKVALVHLAHQLIDWGFVLIDCQIQSDHLDSLGAVSIPRGEFLRILRMHLHDGEERDWSRQWHYPNPERMVTVPGGSRR